MSLIKSTSASNSASQNFFRREFQLLVGFLRQPTRGPRHTLSRPTYWKRILFLSILDITISACILLFLMQFSVFASLDFKHNYKDVFLCFFAVMIAPPIEEFVFRAGLRNFAYSLLIGPLIIAAFVANWWILVILAAVLALETAYLRWKLTREANRGRALGFRLGRQFIQSYRWIFWSYAVAFSLVHLGNYNISKPSDWVVIFAVLPQLFAGVVWAYGRLRMNLLASIILHIIHNGVFVLIALAV